MAALDASAVLTLLFAETGAEAVQAHLPGAVLGAANLVEVLSKLSDRGMPDADAILTVDALGLDIVPMTMKHAERAAAMRRLTRGAGLSLGDRACLALAADLGTPAVTADRAWGAVAQAVGVSVVMVR